MESGVSRRLYLGGLPRIRGAYVGRIKMQANGVLLPAAGPRAAELLPQAINDQILSLVDVGASSGPGECRVCCFAKWSSPAQVAMTLPERWIAVLVIGSIQVSRLV